MRKIDAILFDLDGTLVDTLSCVEASWRSWCEDFGIDYEVLKQHMHGVRGADIIARFLPHLDQEAELESLVAREMRFSTELTPITGVAEFLNQLQIPWGIVTMSTTSMALDKLKIAGLPVPEILVTADMVSAGKPDPAPYLLGAEKLGMDPAGILVFEDAEAGVQSGLAAGMQVAQMGWEHGASIPGTIAAFTDWREVDLTALAPALPRSAA